MIGACPPKPLWYRSVYREHIISEVHAVGRSLCYGSETCNLQHNNNNNTVLTINTPPSSQSRINWICLTQKTQSCPEKLRRISGLECVKVRGKQCCAVEGGLPSIRVHFSGYWLYLATGIYILLQLQFCNCGHLLWRVVRFLMCMLLLWKIPVSMRKFYSFDWL